MPPVAAPLAASSRPLVPSEQQALEDRTGTATGLPRGAGSQQAVGSAAAATDVEVVAPGAQQADGVVDYADASLNTGMLPSVWKCSQAMPCGSVIQCFSLRA